MTNLITICLFAALPLTAQVHLSKADVIKIDIDGKPFTEIHKGSESGKPYLAPLRSASGKIITRHFPMEKVAGESKDHPHHTGLWFSYDDVNGVKFWENDPSYTKPAIGRIVWKEEKLHDGPKHGTLKTIFEWQDHSGKIQLVENRTMTFYSDPTLRMIDFDITLTAPGKVVFGDTKEGAFAIRLADSMIEKKGGKIVNAEGKSGMAAVWGKRSAWVDYSGDVEGEKLGIAIFDHPTNPRFPTYWHVRDYGLFALNPFGQQAFDKDQPESHWTLEAGKSLHFLWRVVIHPGDSEAAHVADLYKKFIK